MTPYAIAPHPLAAVAILLAVLVAGCSKSTEPDSGQDAGARSAIGGKHDQEGGEGHEGAHREHARDGGEHHSGSGEESGEESNQQFARGEKCDYVRNGARLVLAFDPEASAFVGTVENATNETLEAVRVEVHLSSGQELGPTARADLGPGESREIRLPTAVPDFTSWSAHPEVGSAEHGHGSEGRGEHQ